MSDESRLSEEYEGKSGKEIVDEVNEKATQLPPRSDLDEHQRWIILENLVAEHHNFEERLEEERFEGNLTKEECEETLEEYEQLLDVLAPGWEDADSCREIAEKTESIFIGSKPSREQRNTHIQEQIFDILRERGDLRIGQIVINAVSHMYGGEEQEDTLEEYLFDVEDDTLLHHLRRFETKHTEKDDMIKDCPNCGSGDTILDDGVVRCRFCATVFE